MPTGVARGKRHNEACHRRCTGTEGGANACCPSNEDGIKAASPHCIVR
jgi:hypothetical protein